MVDDVSVLCSICIANFNGEEYLDDCLNSIFNQDTKYPIEVIIHDDASTDGSVKLIKEKYPAVNLIVSEENVGFCLSNNRMVDQAKGSFILLLNNDATLFPDAIRTLYKESLSNGNGIYGLPQYDATTGHLIDRGSIFDPFLNPVPNLDISIQNVGMIIGACMWMPTQLWFEIGGFPPWFESLAEDVFLCCCARLKNYPVKCINSSGFSHEVGRSLGGGKVDSNTRLSTTYNRRRLSERNRTFVILICYPVITLILVTPIHIFFLIFEGLVLSLIKCDQRIWTGIYWKCFREVFSAIKLIYRKRKQVQATKIINTKSFFKPFSYIPYKIRIVFKHGLPILSE